VDVKSGSEAVMKLNVIMMAGGALIMDSIGVLF